MERSISQVLYGMGAARLDIPAAAVRESVFANLLRDVRAETSESASGEILFSTHG
jgi:hypothetical protein